MVPPETPTHITKGELIVELEDLSSSDLAHLIDLARKREERQAWRLAEMLNAKTIGYYLRLQQEESA